MPIWLRRYTFHEIKEFYEKEKEEYEKAQGKNTITANTKMDKFKNDPNLKQTPLTITGPSFVSKVKPSSKPTTKK